MEKAKALKVVHPFSSNLVVSDESPSSAKAAVKAGIEVASDMPQQVMHTNLTGPGFLNPLAPLRTPPWGKALP